MVVPRYALQAIGVGADSTSYYARVYSGREGHCVVVGRREVLGWWFCKSSAGRRDLPLVIDAEFTACGKSAL